MSSVVYKYFVFYCRKCFELYGAKDEQNKISEGDTYVCPSCKSELTAELAHSWMKGMAKAGHTELDDDAKERRRQGGCRSGTGPKTSQGKFVSSMNAFKTGRHARKHLLPPANRQYTACHTCPFADPIIEIETVDKMNGGTKVVNHETGGDGSCKTHPFRYCIRQAETLLTMIAANDGGGPAMISSMVGEAQGWMMVILMNALQQVAREGVTIETAWEMQVNQVTTKSGVNIDAHPGLQVIKDIASQLGLRLSEFELTPKSSTEKEQGDQQREILNRLLNPHTQPPETAS